MLGGDHRLEFVPNRAEVISRPHHGHYVAFANDLDVGGNTFCGMGKKAFVLQDHPEDDVINEARAVRQPVGVKKKPKPSADVGRFSPSEASCALRVPQWYPTARR